MIVLLCAHRFSELHPPFRAPSEAFNFQTIIWKSRSGNVSSEAFSNLPLKSLSSDFSRYCTMLFTAFAAFVCSSENNKTGQRDAAVPWRDCQNDKHFPGRSGGMLSELRRGCVCRREPFSPEHCLFAQIPPNQFLRSQLHSFFFFVGGVNAQISRTIPPPPPSTPLLLLCSNMPSYWHAHLRLMCCYLWCGDLFVWYTVAQLRGQTFAQREPESRGVVRTESIASAELLNGSAKKKKKN